MAEKIAATQELTPQSYEMSVSRWGGKAVSLKILEHIGLPVMPSELIGTLELDEEKGITTISRPRFSKVDPTQPFLLRLSAPGDHYHFEGVFPTVGMANPPFDAAGVVKEFGEMLDNPRGKYFLSIQDLRAYCEDRRIPIPSRLQIIAHQYHENTGRGMMMRENDGSILINIDDDSDRIDGLTVAAMRLNPKGEIVYQGFTEHLCLEDDDVVQELFASYRRVESLPYLPPGYLVQWEFTVDDKNHLKSHQFRHTIPKKSSNGVPISESDSQNSLFFDDTEDLLPFGATPESGISVPFLVLTLTDLTDYGPDYDIFLEKHHIDKTQPYGLLVLNNYDRFLGHMAHFSGFPLSWQLGNIQVAVIEGVSTERYLQHETTGVLSRVPYVAVGSSFTKVADMCKARGLSLETESGGVLPLTYISNGSQVLIKPI